MMAFLTGRHDRRGWSVHRESYSPPGRTCASALATTVHSSGSKTTKRRPQPLLYFNHGRGKGPVPHADPVSLKSVQEIEAISKMESPGSKHRRNVSTKSTRPRQSTKGPLDAPDELSTVRTHSSQGSQASSHYREQMEHLPLNKSFSYLLQPETYHPLSQLEVPPAFRSEFPRPSPNDSLENSLAALEDLLKDGHFLPAAHFAAAILTSSAVPHNDYPAIFHVLYIRLACLELTGNTILAAQEAKALEDLNSSFYFLNAELEAAGAGRRQGSSRGALRHIVPWHLRVLAVRLQSIGFGDARRGISGLYELGLEARKHILQPGIGQHEQDKWKERLADLGIRVINALIEMGDLDAARRSLANTKMPRQGDTTNVTRLALLNLRIGDVDAARQQLESISHGEGGLLKPLVSMAEGRYSDAVEEWKSVRESHLYAADEAMVTQNLAVCLLYVGKLIESREILESLVENEYSFQGLTFNLATIYELCSENSNSLKRGLTEKISSQPHSPTRNWERPNADFKM